MRIEFKRMILYVTRHGETEYNVSGRYCGSTDIALNDNGIRQAYELSQRLKAHSAVFGAIASSPMLRARQTADIICASLNMQYSIYEEFTERDLGVYEGLTRNEAKERYPHLWNRQCTRMPDDAPDGGETLRQAFSRIDAGIMRMLQGFIGNTVLLICFPGAYQSYF